MPARRGAGRATGALPMMRRRLGALLCVALVVATAWLGSRGYSNRKPEAAWAEVVPGVFRAPGLPAGYALVDGDTALLIDAPVSATGLQAQGVRKIDAVLLTHHHRDTCAAAASFLAARVPVRAAPAAAEWLTPEN